MSITVTPFAAGCGADIGGVDIREPLSAADRDAIRAAWLANLVLRFRDQPMDDAQHMAFTRQFGELEFNPAVLSGSRISTPKISAPSPAANGLTVMLIVYSAACCSSSLGASTSKSLIETRQWMRSSSGG